MKLKLQRVRQVIDCTKGELFINDVKECLTLEDVHQDVKIFGATRIPSGKYNLHLNIDGGMNKRSPYVSYPWHKGMIEVLEVSGFSNVYIHIGNYAKDTDGCILLGRSDVSGKAMISGSQMAYEQFYKKISTRLLSGEICEIEILDEIS